jgi:hypothetical protein
MPYRISVTLNTQAIESLRSAGANLNELVGKIVPDALDIIKEQAVRNLSGVPFAGQNGSFTIQKRSGKLAASVQTQYPYGSPYKGRVFASAKTRYANNPEEYDYAAILEYGRGEVVPKYTPAMQSGRTGAARLAIPGGGNSLVHGVGGFRGMTGRYFFVKRLPPMPGRYWMQAAAESSQKSIQSMASGVMDEFLSKRGL